MLERSALDSDLALGLLSIIKDVIINVEVEEGIEVIYAIIYFGLDVLSHVNLLNGR